MNNPISRPGGWLRNAVPTTKGWRHEKRREILKGASFTQEQIDEYMARTGIVDQLAEKTIKPAVNELVKMRCKKIILGCTELPIAIFAYKSFKKIKKSKVFIDPNLLLANVSMKKYLRK